MDGRGVGPMMKSFLLSACAALTAICCALLCSCSNYRLAGTPVHLPFKSVYVQPVKNFSNAPQATNLLTNAISDAISQTPQLSVANAGDADAVLEVEIVDYKKTTYATRTDDTALAAAFKATIVAECTLSTRAKTIFKKRRVSADAIIYNANANILGNEYQNMPVLTRELGAKIRDAVIGLW